MRGQAAGATTCVSAGAGVAGARRSRRRGLGRRAHRHGLRAVAHARVGAVPHAEDDGCAERDAQHEQDGRPDGDDRSAIDALGARVREHRTGGRRRGGRHHHRHDAQRFEVGTRWLRIRGLRIRVRLRIHEALPLRRRMMRIGSEGGLGGAEQRVDGRALRRRRNGRGDRHRDRLARGLARHRRSSGRAARQRRRRLLGVGLEQDVLDLDLFGRVRGNLAAHDAARARTHARGHRRTLLRCGRIERIVLCRAALVGKSKPRQCRRKRDVGLAVGVVQCRPIDEASAVWLIGDEKQGRTRSGV